MIHPIAFHPDFFGEQADEAGSTRYECLIMYCKMYDKYYSCKYYDLIDEQGVFMLIERSPDYKTPIEAECKPGVAVKSRNGTWSWWFHI